MRLLECQLWPPIHKREFVVRHGLLCSFIIHHMDNVREDDANPLHEPHQMRITSHGKMHDFVEFALNHFKVCLYVLLMGRD
jgi:hypothetical protein